MSRLLVGASLTALLLIGATDLFAAPKKILNKVVKQGMTRVRLDAGSAIQGTRAKLPLANNGRVTANVKIA